jgi:predicted Zn-dependent peptidase
MFSVITGAVDDAVDAVSDGIRRAVANLPGGSASFRVQPDQVYALANRFEAIADRIQGGVAPELMTMWVEPPGADKPSQDAADRLRETGFGGAGLATRLDAYANELRNAAAGLRATGKQYGLTDHTESGRLSAADV